MSETESVAAKPVGEMGLEELIAASNDDRQAMIELQKKLGNFDPFEAVKSANEIFEEFDQRLGYLKFGELTTGENAEIEKIKDNKEREINLMYNMLKKGYLTLTVEDVRKMPAWKTARISVILGTHITRFLPKTTLPTTPKPSA